VAVFARLPNCLPQAGARWDSQSRIGNSPLPIRQALCRVPSWPTIEFAPVAGLGASKRTIDLVNMKIRHNSLILVFLVASLAVFAQQPGSAVPAPAPVLIPGPMVGQPSAHPAKKEAANDAQSAPKLPAAAAKVPDRAEAYYHFQLGHVYEEMVAVTGRTEFASKAVDEYKAALQADPSSSYLASALAELYARTGDIREAVVEAQDVITRDPDNLDARRLLGRIYLRSIGDLQGGTQKDTETILHLAIEQYREIVRLDPASTEDHLLLGRLYRLNNETGKAEARDLGLGDETKLYDPQVNYDRVKHKISDWASDPAPTAQSTRTVDTPAQDGEIPAQ